MNRNNNMDTTAKHSLLSSMLDLKSQLAQSESETAQKESRILELELELESLKASKSEVLQEMSSKDAEITMQKERLNYSRTESEDGHIDLDPAPSDLEILYRKTWPTQTQGQGSGDAQLRICAQEGISEAERLVSQIKTDSANLFARTELLEKNILIYQSHQTFKQLEEDYFSLIASTEPLDKIKERRDSGFFNGCAEDSTQFALRRQVQEIKSANLNLRKRVEEVAEQVGRMSKEMSQVDLQTPQTVDLSRLAAYIHQQFEKLEEEKQEIYIQKRMNAMIQEVVQQIPPGRPVVQYPQSVTSSPTPSSWQQHTSSPTPSSWQQQSTESHKKELATQEIIALQATQIERYEEYVNRLHQEIRDWLPTESSLAKTQTADSNSVIRLLRKKIEEDAKRLPNGIGMNYIKELSARCFVAENNELKLREETNFLRGIVQDLNKLYAEQKSNFQFK